MPIVERVQRMKTQSVSRRSLIVSRAISSRSLSLRSLFVVFLSVLVASSSLMAQNRRERDRRAGEARRKARVEAIRSAIAKYIEKGTTSGISSGMRSYLRAESARELDIFATHSIHRAVLAQLRKVDGVVVFNAAKSYVKKSTGSNFPAQVVLLKAVGKGGAGVKKSARMELFLTAAKKRDRGLATWGVRLLAEERHAEGIDALIDLLEEEEFSGRYFGDLASVIQGELYRVLGSIAVGNSGQIRKAWKSIGKKIPKKPDYKPGKGGGGGGKTVFFGDRIASRAVFCIDLSSSMNGKVSARGSKGQQRKVDIVKAELEKAVGGLSPENRFNIVTYDKGCAPWRSRGKLQKANVATVKNAKEFARELETGSGTNIHDAMVMGLKIEDVESIYLLSDGSPSVGGNPDQIRKRVAAMNYLAGIRVITYGFAGSDAALMRDLAKRNWGWYRELNK